MVRSTEMFLMLPVTNEWIAGIAGGLSGGITGGFAKESHWTEYPKKIEIEEEDEFATGSRYEAWQRDNIAFTAPYKPRPYRTLETEETECELECGTPSGLTQSTIKATPADSYAYRYLLAQEMIESDEGDESKDHKRKVEDRRHDTWMRHMPYEHPEYFEGPVEQLSSELDKAEHAALAGVPGKMDKPSILSHENSSSACWEGPAHQLNAWECEEVQDLGLLSAEEIRENIRANTAAIGSLRAISKARARKEAVEDLPASTPASESSLTAEETPNQPERISAEVPSAQSTSPTDNPDSNHPTRSLTPPEEDQAQQSQPERSLAFMPLSPVVDSASNQDSANIARTTYRTLIYEPTNDIITEITSESPMTSDTAIPLYSALARLNTPGKFLQRVVDRLGTGDEIIAAQGNVLAIRKAPEHLETVDKITGISDIPLPRFGTRPTESQPKSADDGSEAAGFQPEKDNAPTEAYAINPIDGTMAASLSPTGYAGVDPTIEAAGNDPYADEDGALRKAYWDKTRQEHNSREGMQAVGRNDHWRRENERGQKKVKERGRTAGVAKTALWAATVCYVASIVAELVK